MKFICSRLESNPPKVIARGTVGEVFEKIIRSSLFNKMRLSSSNAGMTSCDFLRPRV